MKEKGLRRTRDGMPLRSAPSSSSSAAPAFAPLSARELDVVDRHFAVAGTADMARVPQMDGLLSVYSATSGRLWVHRDTARKQTLQEYYSSRRARWPTR